MNINYQKVLEQEINKIQNENKIPSLFLHSCCAPCSSYVLEYLSDYFNIVVFYYNPNIHPESEYRKRVEEQKEFIKKLPSKNEIDFIEGEYVSQDFFNMAKGLENVKEGGERCFKCYEMRLRKTAEIAKQKGFDYFTTTLSISPLKNSQKINEIGSKLEDEYGVKFLYSDFKKKNGYKRSIELSKEYNLYRQNYCGCVFSKKDDMIKPQEGNR